MTTELSTHNYIQGLLMLLCTLQMKFKLYSTHAKKYWRFEIKRATNQKPTVEDKAPV